MIMSVLIIVQFPLSAFFTLALHISFLYLIIDLFAIAELVVLLTPDAYQYYRT